MVCSKIAFCMSLDDLPEIREVPLIVLDRIGVAFKSFDGIGYVGDSDLIHAYINIGDHQVILELELGLEGSSLEKEYLIKSVWYNGHDILADELKSFLDYGRDLKRLPWLETKLSAVFSAIPATYNEVGAERKLGGELFTDEVGAAEACLDDAWEQSLVAPALVEHELSGGAVPSNGSFADVLVKHREAERLHADPMKVPLSYAAQPNDPELLSSAVAIPSPSKLRLNHTRVFIGSALIGALAAFPLMRYFVHSPEMTNPAHNHTVPAQPAINRTHTIPRSTPQAPVISPPNAPQCPQIIVIATDSDRGIGPVLRRMQAENRRYFVSSGLSAGVIVTQTIRPRHIAEATARELNDARHALGEMHHYRFGRVVSGDQFALTICRAQAPVFTHVRQGVTLYSFSLR